MGILFSLHLTAIITFSQRLFNTNEQGLCPPEYFKECVNTLIYPFRFVQNASIRVGLSSSDERINPSDEQVIEHLLHARILKAKLFSLIIYSFEFKFKGKSKIYPKFVLIKWFRPL